MYSWWQDHMNKKSFTEARHCQTPLPPRICSTFCTWQLRMRVICCQLGIGLWHKIGQQAYLDCPSSSHICCLHLCLVSFFGSLDRVLIMFRCSCLAEYTATYSWWQDHINKKSFTAARHLARLLFHPGFVAHFCTWQHIMRVISCQLLYWALTQDRAISLIGPTLLISYLLLAFVLGIIFGEFG